MINLLNNQGIIFNISTQMNHIYILKFLSHFSIIFLDNLIKTIKCYSGYSIWFVLSEILLAILLFKGINLLEQFLMNLS